jgi:hypothetical protein
LPNTLEVPCPTAIAVRPPLAEVFRLEAADLVDAVGALVA